MDVPETSRKELFLVGTQQPSVQHGLGVKRLSCYPEAPRILLGPGDHHFCIAAAVIIVSIGE